MFGAELMARAVERQGVKTVFGLPGHLEAFCGALQDRNIRLIHQRHESAVVLSADGCARVRRSIGVACVTAGPGLANSLGGLASAYMACTPLLVFCGRNEFRVAGIGALQGMGHTRAPPPAAPPLAAHAPPPPRGARPKAGGPAFPGRMAPRAAREADVVLVAGKR